MGFGGIFRLRLMDQKVRDEARLAHPDWDAERVAGAALTHDSGWSKNVITDLGRRLLVSSAWSGGFNIFLHRAANPANVRRTNIQYVYQNALPLPQAAPDTQTNSLALLLQTRTVEFTPPPHQNGTGDDISGGPVIWVLTSALGLFSPEMVGNNITITGAINGANNATFPVTGYLSDTQIQVTGALVAETSAFAWDIGVTRPIAMVGLTQGTFSGYQFPGTREMSGLLAYTVLSSPVIQAANQVADVQYRVTWSLD